MTRRAAPHYVINIVRRQLDMSEQDLWAAYRAHGGGVSQQEISEFLRGVTALGREDLDSLAIALNERFTGETPDPPVQLPDEP